MEPQEMESPQEDATATANARMAHASVAAFRSVDPIDYDLERLYSPDAWEVHVQQSQNPYLQLEYKVEDGSWMRFGSYGASRRVMVLGCDDDRGCTLRFEDEVSHAWLSWWHTHWARRYDVTYAPLFAHCTDEMPTNDPSVTIRC